MIYEIHITVRAGTGFLPAGFKRVYAIGTRGAPQHMLTCVVAGTFQEALDDMAWISSMCVDVVREKIEALVPQTEPALYDEIHIPLLPGMGPSLPFHVVHSAGGHVSTNAAKHPAKLLYTFRDTQKAAAFVVEHGHRLGKAQREWVVHDTNPGLDDDWILPAKL